MGKRENWVGLRERERETLSRFKRERFRLAGKTDFEREAEIKAKFERETEIETDLSEAEFERDRFGGNRYSIIVLINF